MDCAFFTFLVIVSISNEVERGVMDMLDLCFVIVDSLLFLIFVSA